MTDSMTNQQHPTQLMSIGDFARAASLSVSAVRFYGDRQLLVPAKVDPSNGYRSYAPNQVGRACLVRDLRVLGMSLAAITAAVELSPDELADAVAGHIGQLETNVERARSIADRLAEPNSASTSQPTSEPTTVRVADLRSAFEQVLPMTSSNTELPHLMTVRLESLAGSVRVVATDTYRLAVRDIVPISAGEDFVALIATATIQKLLPQLASLDTVALQLRNNTLTISADGVELSAQAVPADFPNYEPFLAKPAKATALVIDRTVLRDTLETFDDDGAVLLSTSADHLRIERRDQHASIGASSSGPDVHVALNAQFAIDSIDGAIADEVVIEIEDDPARPVVFRSATDGTYVSMLMPVLLDPADAADAASRS